MIVTDPLEPDLQSARGFIDREVDRIRFAIESFNPIPPPKGTTTHDHQDRVRRHRH